jgi:serine phosphatase RsbU (regulator of sigma subunit)
MQIDRFVTLVVGLIDIDKHRVEIVNAGHMPPIIRKSDSGEVAMVAMTESGLPLGIMEDAEYTVVNVDLASGDTMVMYTDGFNESMDIDGNQLTIAAMLKEVKDSQTKTAAAIGKVLCEAASRHAGSQNPIDDMCLVCVGRK